MQRNNALMQLNAMQSIQRNAIHCKQYLAGVFADACGGARHVALYAGKMHDLQACI